VDVKLRNVARWCALTGLAAALAVTARAESAPPDRLPPCPGGPASTGAPTVEPGFDSPGACRAAGHIQESGARPEDAGFTPSGYHHLGANTAGTWSGVSGRFSVVDGTVRPGTYDFVAGRFMVKRDLGAGQISWLEAGWAETGWSDPGRQHIYTFNTNTKTWQFYDQYTLKPGDKIWLDEHSDRDGTWAAWLWWNNRWNLLTAQKLPIGPDAYVEQYVEVHVDASRPARIDVPTVKVDNVQLRPPGGGTPRFWRADVPTLTGGVQRSGGFCLNWMTRYDTWTAGDCDPDVDVKTEDQDQPLPVRPRSPAPVASVSTSPSAEPRPAAPPASAAPASVAPASVAPASVAPEGPDATVLAPEPPPATSTAPRRRGLLGGLLG
jgi:hypothetical protein